MGGMGVHAHARAWSQRTCMEHGHGHTRRQRGDRQAHARDGGRAHRRVGHVLFEVEARKVVPVQLAMRPALFGKLHPVVHRDGVDR